MSRQPPQPRPPHRQAEHAAHSRRLRGRGPGPLPQLKAFSGGHTVGRAVGWGKGEATELGQTWGGHSGAQDGRARGATYIAHDRGGGPGEADLGWGMLAMSWGEETRVVGTTPDLEDRLC